MNTDNITSINSIIINIKALHTFIWSCFFYVIDAKSFNIFPKRSEYGLISESFPLSWYIFVAFTNKKNCCLLYNADLNKSFSLSCKINGIFRSCCYCVSFNFCVAPSQRTYISFYLLSISTDEEFYTPKIMIFLS